MKKFIAILLVLICTKLVGQSLEYPRFEVDSTGQKVVVMTIEQAQALDNSTDLIPLFNKLNVQVGGVDSACIKVVNDKDVVIAKQQIQINEQKQLVIIKDREITNLQSQIFDYKNTQRVSDLQLSNKDKEIKLHLDKIKDQKIKMWIGGATSGLVIVGLILGIITNN